MIKELRLKNWKSFEDSTLYIDPLTILIGTNASGKSNALDALLFLNRVSLGVSIADAIKGNAAIPPLRGGMDWVSRKPGTQFTLEVIVGGEAEDQEYRYGLTIQVNGAKAEVFKETLTKLTYQSGIEKPVEENLFKSEQSDTPIIRSFILSSTLFTHIPVVDIRKDRALETRKDWTEIARRILLSKLKGVFIFDPIPSHMRDYSPLSEKLKTDGSNIAGLLAGFEESHRLELEETLTKYLSALPEGDIKRLWTEPVGKFQTDAMLYCEEGWKGSDPHEIDARGMSDGTLRYLAIVVALLTREPGSLLVVEEVDNGLHPSRAGTLIEMLKTLGRERGIDVIATTHNPAVLNAAAPRMIPFITVAHRSTKTGASKLTQLEDIQQLPKLMAMGSLGRLSEEGRIASVLNQEGA